MDFDLDEDQHLLKDSVGRMLAVRYGDLSKRQNYMAEPEGFSRAVWAEYAEAGILALPIDAAHGGLGGGPIETMIFMQEFGQALAVEPWLTSSVLCGTLLRLSGNRTLADAILPAVAAGTAVLALAHQERASRFDLAAVGLRARRDGDQYVLEGDKSLVIGGGAADFLVVAARTAGEAGDPHGLTLLVVDARSSGISRHVYPTQDGFQAADIAFRQVAVPHNHALGEIDGGLPLLTRAVDEAIAGVCAEAVGAMDALLQMTVEYLKTRRQFGVPIGSFQALQHRAVEMHIMLEQARSMALFAAFAIADEDATRRRLAVSAAKVQIGRAARFIGQQAVQLHGGIAMTMEYKGGHYFKRLTMIEQQFGDTEHHLRCVAALGSPIDG
jgi:pimeloyl-CoA dehydrogenase small subunit